MVLSELIEKLKILKEKHGDLEILVWTKTGFTPIEDTAHTLGCAHVVTKF